MPTAYLVAPRRTPIGSLGGALASLTAVELGRHASLATLETSGIDPAAVAEVYLGNVVSANLGQAPARQVALGVGLPASVPCTTVNKVCASGMKAIALAAQAVQLGHAEVVLAGGFESMSRVPYYVPDARFGYRFGGGTLVDGLQRDGLQDAYDHVAMGVSADQTAAECGISREAQDEYAAESYRRAAAATDAGRLAREIAAVQVPQRRGDAKVVDRDEEYAKVVFEKLPRLRPAFSADGTVTAANASTINDGAAAVLVVGEDALHRHGLTPLARIAGYADAAREPMRFPLAPNLAAPRALERAGVQMAEVGVHEVNEAFAVVPLAYRQAFDLDPATVNPNGGAVSLGHPLGMSGARIVNALAFELASGGARYGLASICNGGGGASAMLLERA